MRQPETAAAAPARPASFVFFLSEAFSLIVVIVVLAAGLSRACLTLVRAAEIPGRSRARGTASRHPGVIAAAFIAASAAGRPAASATAIQ